MKINTAIVELAAVYVSELFESKLQAGYCYHNITHATNVVRAANDIASGMKLPNHQRNILLTACWFHDIGYIWKIDGHEEAGAEAVAAFLADNDIDAEDIAAVRACILSTKYPQQPANLLGQIICDADLSHLGEKEFFDKTALVREEWRITRNLNYNDCEWHALNLGFMEKHNYHTIYCRKQYDKRKRKNIKQVADLLTEQQNKLPVVDENEEMIRKTNKTFKDQRMERGVETLFRTASRNHMQLSSMADSKAHILLTINSIIISIVISLLTRRLEQSPYLIIPTSLLLIVCLVTVVFAVLTTKPKISKGIFTKDQVAKREANLLFFGNFHNMDLRTYDWGVKEIMNDKEYLYSSMTRDVYYLGKVLAGKYRYLNVGYKIFMYGLIASVLTFALCFFFANQP
jgi:predicted metal-dependent HD superfamily phosphohydrolase